jgi:hypothetical protein
MLPENPSEKQIITIEEAQQVLDVEPVSLVVLSLIYIVH